MLQVITMSRCSWRPGGERCTKNSRPSRGLEVKSRRPTASTANCQRKQKRTFGRSAKRSEKDFNPSTGQCLTSRPCNVSFVQPQHRRGGRRVLPLQQHFLLPTDLTDPTGQLQLQLQQLGESFDAAKKARGQGRPGLASPPRPCL